MSNTAPTLTVTTATADHAQHKPGNPLHRLIAVLNLPVWLRRSLHRLSAILLASLFLICTMVGTWPSHSTIPTFPIPTIPIPAHPVLRAFRNFEILRTCNKSAAFKLTKGSTCPPVVDVTLHSTVQCKLVCGPTLILNPRTHSHVILDKGIFQTPVQQT